MTAAKIAYAEYELYLENEKKMAQIKKDEQEKLAVIEEKKYFKAEELNSARDQNSREF